MLVWIFGGNTFGEENNAPSGATGFYSKEYFYIVPDKCTECVGFHDEPQCASVCPVDCCVPDEAYVETVEVLMKRKSMVLQISVMNQIAMVSV